MLKRLFPYAQKHRKYLMLACACVILETVFELVIPTLMADIIDIGVAVTKDIFYGKVPK